MGRCEWAGVNWQVRMGRCEWAGVNGMCARDGVNGQQVRLDKRVEPLAAERLDEGDVGTEEGRKFARGVSLVVKESNLLPATFRGL